MASGPISGSVCFKLNGSLIITHQMYLISTCSSSNRSSHWVYIRMDDMKPPQKWNPSIFIKGLKGVTVESGRCMSRYCDTPPPDPSEKWRHILTSCMSSHKLWFSYFCLCTDWQMKCNIPISLFKGVDTVVFVSLCFLFFELKCDTVNLANQL